MIVQTDNTRQFPGEIPPHTFTEDPAEKYKRDHEKRRLKAYLKGKEYFTHGRKRTIFGYQPLVWSVVPKETAINPEIPFSDG
mgnify:FL=1